MEDVLSRVYHAILFGQRDVHCTLLQPCYLSRSLILASLFLDTEPPRELHTLHVVRAPEAIFKDKLDFRVDLWSMGCMVCLSLIASELLPDLKPPLLFLGLLVHF